MSTSDLHSSHDSTFQINQFSSPPLPSSEGKRIRKRKVHQDYLTVEDVAALNRIPPGETSNSTSAHDDSEVDELAQESDAGSDYDDREENIAFLSRSNSNTSNITAATSGRSSEMEVKAEALRAYEARVIVTREERVARIISSLLAQSHGSNQVFDSENNPLWNDRVSNALLRGLNLIPKLGRKKFNINGRDCGMNEMLSFYIERITGETRSAEEVLAQIQLLKQLNGKYAAFREILEGGRDTEFSEENKEKFFGHDYTMVQLESHQSSSDLNVMGYKVDLWAQHTEGPASPGVIRASSSFDSALAQLSTTESAESSTIPTSKSLPTIFRNDRPHSAGSPSKRKTAALPPVKIQPVSFALYTESLDICNLHIFAQIDVDLPPLADQVTTNLEDVVDFDIRFPQLAEMIEKLDCPVELFNINLDIPVDGYGNASQKETGLIGGLKNKYELISDVAERLTSVTSIYSFGEKLVTIDDRMEPPVLLNAPSPNSTKLQINKYLHNAPFVLPFFSAVLKGFQMEDREIAGGSRGTFYKTVAELEDFQASLAGLTIIQEFVCPKLGGDNISEAKRGNSKDGLGEILLVVAYSIKSNHFERESLGRVEVTRLIRKRPVPVPTLADISSIVSASTPVSPAQRIQPFLSAADIVNSPPLAPAYRPRQRHHSTPHYFSMQPSATINSSLAGYAISSDRHSHFNPSPASPQPFQRPLPDEMICSSANLSQHTPSPDSITTDEGFSSLSDQPSSLIGLGLRWEGEPELSAMEGLWESHSDDIGKCHHYLNKAISKTSAQANL